MWPLKKRISLKESGIFEDFTDCHSHILPGVDDGPGECILPACHSMVSEKSDGNNK